MLFVGYFGPSVLKPWLPSAVQSNGSSTAQSCGRLTARQKVSVNFSDAGPEPVPEFSKLQRIRPVVAEMEFPVRVERKMFARRFGGGKLRDQQRGARAGNKSANNWNDFHFQIQISNKFGGTCKHCAANQWIIMFR